MACFNKLRKTAKKYLSSENNYFSVKKYSEIGIASIFLLTGIASLNSNPSNNTEISEYYLKNNRVYESNQSNKRLNNVFQIQDFNKPNNYLTYRLKKHS